MSETLVTELLRYCKRTYGIDLCSSSGANALLRAELFLLKSLVCLGRAAMQQWFKFGIISRRAIKRGSFRNVKELVQRIKEFTERYNRGARPFVWTATAQSIIDKVARLSTLICGTAH